ncbi:MAG TPA: type IV toxin-antitoxin system AbiEi family antitoxin domain-containing protein, partial [Glaciihabitans sp.]|nr:type IV toxin-antitoxin system AbiEi family antitoxin domain-containing protein [Glaciihabitans sp.]
HYWPLWLLCTAPSGNTGTVLTIDSLIRVNGGFRRRRDLRAHGMSDGMIRAALAAKRIFRVRHGWYSVPDAPVMGIRAVRLGGRLTGIAALESYGLRVPHNKVVDIVVPAGACRLRNPEDRTQRLAASAMIRTSAPAAATTPAPVARVRVHWTDPPRHKLRSTSWRVSIDDALLMVLSTESRDVAVACACAIANHKRWPPQRMDAVFARAPSRAQRWRALVSALDDSHGETFVRLWLGDAGIACESQPQLAGIGRLDFRISPNVYVEVDGAQHDENWTGGTPSSWQSDRSRDIAVTIRGGRVLRWTYRHLYRHWANCLAAAERARADDVELIARRERHPPLPRSVLRTLRRAPT